MEIEVAAGRTSPEEEGPMPKGRQPADRPHQADDPVGRFRGTDARPGTGGKRSLRARVHSPVRPCRCLRSGGEGLGRLPRRGGRNGHDAGSAHQHHQRGPKEDEHPEIGPVHFHLLAEQARSRRHGRGLCRRRTRRRRSRASAAAAADQHGDQSPAQPPADRLRRQMIGNHREGQHQRDAMMFPGPLAEKQHAQEDDAKLRANPPACRGRVGGLARQRISSAKRPMQPLTSQRPCCGLRSRRLSYPSGCTVDVDEGAKTAVRGQPVDEAGQRLVVVFAGDLAVDDEWLDHLEVPPTLLVLVLLATREGPGRSPAKGTTAT